MCVCVLVRVDTLPKCLAVPLTETNFGGVSTTHGMPNFFFFHFEWQTQCAHVITSIDAVSSQLIYCSLYWFSQLRRSRSLVLVEIGEFLLRLHAVLSMPSHSAQSLSP